MDTNVEPVVYTLTLTCGHEQLVSHPRSLGDVYPCWTACNPDEPMHRTVADIKIYVPNPNVGIVVASKLNNDEMLHLNRTVDEVNKRLTAGN